MFFLKKKRKESIVYRHRDNGGRGPLKTTGKLSAQENNHPASKGTGFFVLFDSKQTSHALMRYFPPDLCEATDIWHVGQIDQKWPTACINV